MIKRFHAIKIEPKNPKDKRAALFSIVGFSYAEPPIELKVGRRYLIQSTIMPSFFYKIEVLNINSAGMWCESVDTTAYECTETGQLGKNIGNQNFTRVYFEIIKEYS